MEEKMKKLEDKVTDELGRDIKLTEETEIAQVFNNLDDDRENAGGLSKIDFNTRLSKDEINAIMVIEELKQMGLFPEEARITAILKRNNISLQGKGREEKVKIASAKREEQISGGWNRLKSMFGGGE